MFFVKHVHRFMSRIAITLKFKMCLFLDEACSWAEKLFTDINVPLLMPGGNINYALNVIHAYIYLTEVGLKYATVQLMSTY